MIKVVPAVRKINPKTDMGPFIWDRVVTKKMISLILCVAMVALIYVLFTRHTAHVLGFDKEGKGWQEVQVQPNVYYQRYLEQRNALSKELNLMKKVYGQQSCEKLKILKLAGKQVDSRVSENGGWCFETSGDQTSEHMWDKEMSTGLSKFFKGKTVASFGDGPGAYKKHIDSLGEVISYTAYDGAPFCESVTNGVVKFLDLTATQFGLPFFDWVVSLEVAEHIPAKYEEIYLSNIARHAKEGVVLSWAEPGQFGLSHVNNKAFVDVVAQMKKYGFDINTEAGAPLREAATFPWLKKNINVYYRIDPKTFVPEDA